MRGGNMVGSIDIIKPCMGEVNKYLKRWVEKENLFLPENALNKLFHVTYPKNHIIDDVLIKVSALNNLYGTNLYEVVLVAKNIVSQDIDKRLQAGDVTLVNDIAMVKMKNEKKWCFYSFATKYCSHHNHFDYPIYDSYVDKVLRHFRKVDGFCSFVNSDLRKYEVFKQTIIDFRKYYGLEDFNLKEIDKYLWLLGKEMFPNQF